MMHKSLKFLSKIFWVPHPYTTLSFSKWSGIFLRRKIKIFYDGQLTTIEDKAVNLMYKKKIITNKKPQRKLFMSMVDDFARVTPLGAMTAVGLGAVSAVGLVFALFLG